MTGNATSDMETLTGGLTGGAGRGGAADANAVTPAGAAVTGCAVADTPVGGPVTLTGALTSGAGTTGAELREPAAGAGGATVVVETLTATGGVLSETPEGATAPASGAATALAADGELAIGCKRAAFQADAGNSRLVVGGDSTAMT